MRLPLPSLSFGDPLLPPRGPLCPLRPRTLPAAPTQFLALVPSWGGLTVALGWLCGGQEVGEEGLRVMRSLHESVRETGAVLAGELLTERQRRQLLCRQVEVLKEAVSRFSETRAALLDEIAGSEQSSEPDSRPDGSCSVADARSPACEWSDEPGGSSLDSREEESSGSGSSAGAWKAESPVRRLGGLACICGALLLAHFGLDTKLPEGGARVLRSVVATYMMRSKRSVKFQSERLRSLAFTAARRRGNLREGVHYPRTGCREYVSE